MLSGARCGVLLLAVPLLALGAGLLLPELTGRVVDAAGLLDTTTERELTARLAAHEEATGNQVVVVTLPDLQGRSIEEFGVALGRHWGIGQAGQDNGVILLVADAERKVRIEVGYGLEGALPDAIAANIIQTRILPQFRSGDFDAGVRAGVEAILQAIAGEYVPAQRRQRGLPPLALFMVLGLIVLVFTGLSLAGGQAMRGRGRRGGGWSSGSWGGGGGFGSGSGGGFSGGGGSFGGGGASGGW